MDKPNLKSLMEAVPISKSYAAVILNGKQPPSLPLAGLIFQQTGWRHDVAADLSDETLRELADKWTPPAKAEAA